MEIVIDTSEVQAFAGRMAGVDGILDREMRRAGDTVLTEAVGFAQEFAPVDEDTLRNSIGIVSRDGWGGTYGTSLEYAWMRERGGTIHGNPWLVFQVNGQWVKVRSVTQSGSHYMERSRQRMDGRAQAIYEMALQRVINSIGGGP